MGRNWLANDRKPLICRQFLVFTSPKTRLTNLMVKTIVSADRGLAHPLILTAMFRRLGVTTRFGDLVPLTAILLIATVIPCTAPTLAESLFESSGETETALEDVTECVTVSDECRVRRRRKQLWNRQRSYGSSSSRPFRATVSRCGVSGHRLDNGLLAPRLC